MDITSIIEKISYDWAQYREALKRTLVNESSLLTDINSYLINTQGKQLRPLLSLLSANVCGGANQQSYSCAAVAEIIHTATLLHDDVADSGEYRRGKPTVRVAYSPAVSVLAGDYWLSKALHILSYDCPSQVLQYYTHAMSELAVGELIQMEKADKLDATKADYYNIIGKKTASLFIAATKSGACSAGANYEQMSAIECYALHLGYAFQIRDDIFDYSPNIRTGKDYGADISERKITLPLLCAFSLSSAAERESIIAQIGQIDNNPLALKSGSDNKNIIDYVNSFVKKFNGVEQAQVLLEGHVHKAVDALNVFNESVSRQSLADIANYVGIREK